MNTMMTRIAAVLLAATAFVGTAQTSAKQAKPSAASKPATQSPTKPVAPSAATAAAKSGDQLDINTATADQLKALPGVGDVYAKRIIDGRPYTMKNQLTQRGILPQATYDKIKDQIVAHRPAKK